MPVGSSIRNSGIRLTGSAGCGILDSTESAHTYFPFPYCIMDDQTTPATKADIGSIDQRIDKLDQQIDEIDMRIDRVGMSIDCVDDRIDRVEASIDALAKLVTGMRSDMLSWKDEVVSHFDSSLQSLEAKLLDFHELEKTSVVHERRITRLEQTLTAA